jgi:hypothetical protein
MGYWAWAEMSTGIIISCLPVVPRFVQHFGRKYHHHCRPRAGSNPAQKSLSDDSKNKAGHSAGSEAEMLEVDH